MQVFKKLFGIDSSNSTPQNKDKQYEKQNEKKNYTYLLTEMSKRCDACSLCHISLWNHQKAMLARCIEIENSNRKVISSSVFKERFNPPARDDKEKQKEPKHLDLKNTNIESSIGIMSDGVGVGKSYTILSLIANDIINGLNRLNVIIVPKNLVKQWVTYLETIFPRKSEIKTVRWKLFNSYDMVSSLYLDSSKIKDCQIILLNEIFYDTFALACASRCLRFYRLVIDEIDNQQNTMTIPINADKIWLLSASFHPENDTENKQIYSIGPYHINKYDLSYIICQTDPDFIKKSIKLPEPETEILKCNDSELRILENVIDKPALTGINALNILPTIKFTGYQSTSDSFRIETGICKDIAQFYEKILINNIQSGNELIKNLEQKVVDIELDDPDNEGFINSLKETIKKTQTNIIDYKSKLFNLKKNLDKYKNENNTNKTKPEIFINEIITRIKNQPESKWLIFNDDPNGLNFAETLLKEHDIESKALDGGNIDSVNKVLLAYEKDECRVLLLNSASEGCGLNLQQTTHLLFMHATKPELVCQVVGRAQRYGRTCPLHIIGMFNENELKDIENGGISI